jgi:hypothetical protein
MLDAVQDDRFDLVLEKLRDSQRAKDSEVKEAFELFTKAQATSFWEFTLRNTKSCIQRILARVGEGSDATSSPEAEDDFAKLKSVIFAMNTYSSVSKARPQALITLLDTAQGVLALQSSSASIVSLRSSVAKICEVWWSNNEEGAENLIAQLITYLLMASLSIDGHESDIKRLYALRSGFLLLDFDDASSAFLRDLVERCFVHPSFLRCNEGQKLLAFLLTSTQGKYPCMLHVCRQVVFSPLLRPMYDRASVGAGQFGDPPTARLRQQTGVRSLREGPLHRVEGRAERCGRRRRQQRCRGGSKGQAPSLQCCGQGPAQ